MKKRTLLIAFFLALTLTASAQMIDFTGLGATATPTAVPEGYAGLNWTGIDYVSPLTWNYTNGTTEKGDGFVAGPEAMVAFGGGPLCYKKHGGTTTKNICSAIIAAGVGPTALSSFNPVSVDIAAGWASDGQQFVTVQAYSDGNLMGSLKFDLQTQAQKFTLVFPNWGPITELKFIPSPGGSFVIYVLQMQ